jgi:hypothetical protein
MNLRTCSKKNGQNRPEYGTQGKMDSCRTGTVHKLGRSLALVAQTLFVAVFFHPLFAFVFGDFGFASLFKGTHEK